jgi:hypothetical protein
MVGAMSERLEISLELIIAAGTLVTLLVAI